MSSIKNISEVVASAAASAAKIVSNCETKNENKNRGRYKKSNSNTLEKHLAKEISSALAKEIAANLSKSLCFDEKPRARDNVYRPRDIPSQKEDKKVPYYRGNRVDPNMVMTNQMRTDVFAMMKDPIMQARNNLYCRMCNFSKEDCPEGESCVFAHSAEQLRKPKCWFGQYCKKSAKECSWDHNPNHVIPEMPPKKKKAPKVEEEKFLLNISPDEDEDEIIEIIEESEEEPSPVASPVASPVSSSQVSINAFDIDPELEKFIELVKKSQEPRPSTTSNALYSEDELSLLEEDNKTIDKWNRDNPLKPLKGRYSPFDSKFRKVLDSRSNTPCIEDQRMSESPQLSGTRRKIDHTHEQSSVNLKDIEALVEFAEEDELNALIAKIQSLALKKSKKE